MARKKPLMLTAGALTISSLLGAAIGELLPKPTDSIFFYLMRWKETYVTMLDPGFQKFVEIWAYYFLSAMWYLSLVAIILVFKVKLTKTVMVLLAISVGFWIARTPVIIPMDFQIGMNIVIGSVLVFGILVGMIFWEFKQIYEIEVE